MIFISQESLRIARERAAFERTRRAKHFTLAHCPSCNAERICLSEMGVSLLRLRASKELGRVTRICLSCGFLASQRPIRDKALRQRIIQADCYECVYCGDRPKALTIDHIHPQSLGGSDSFDNLVAACKACNARKRDRLGFTPMFGRFRSQP